MELNLKKQFRFSETALVAIVWLDSEHILDLTDCNIEKRMLIIACEVLSSKEAVKRKDKGGAPGMKRGVHK
jgi:hypothetical protein